MVSRPLQMLILKPVVTVRPAPIKPISGTSLAELTLQNSLRLYHDSQTHLHPTLGWRLETPLVINWSRNHDIMVIRPEAQNSCTF